MNRSHPKAARALLAAALTLTLSIGTVSTAVAAPAAPAGTLTSTASTFTRTTATTATTVTAAGPITGPSAAYKQQVTDIFNGINNFRASKGLPKLKLGAAAGAVAQDGIVAASQMAVPDHNKGFGTDPRVADQISGGAENLAGWQTTSGQDAVNGWIGSPDHNLNMSGPSYNVVGIGYMTDDPAFSSLAMADFYTYANLPTNVFDTPDDYFAYLAKPELTAGTVAITGKPQQRLALTATTSGFTTPGTTLAYQWYRNRTPSTGATAASYTLSDADVAQTVQVRVVATAPGYRPLDTNVAGPQIWSGQPSATGWSIITGNPQAGETLQAAQVQWSPTETVVTYQWLRDGVDILGATGTSLLLTTADVGHAMSVRQTGTYFDLTKSYVSSPTMPVTDPAVVSHTTEPTITGQLVVGKTLTVNPGTWETGTTFTYQWRRDRTPIDGATGTTYTLTDADLNTRIYVDVTATKDQKLPSTVSAFSGGYVTPVPMTWTTRTPTIGGTLTGVGYLRVDGGTWPAGVGLDYQWYRDGVKVGPSTTQPVYLTTSTDMGHRFMVAVTASDGYTSVTRQSAATAPLGPVAAPAPTPAPAPAPSGPTLRLGDVIAVDPAGVLWNYHNQIGSRTRVGTGWQGATTVVDTDWNADGVPDILAQWNTGEIRLYRGVRTGGFTMSVIGRGWQSMTIAVGKMVRGASRPEIIARSTSGALYRYGNPSGGFMAPGVKIGSGWQGLTFIITDWANDGTPDLLVRNGRGQLLVYRTDGRGRFLSQYRPIVGYGWGGYAYYAHTLNGRNVVLGVDPAGGQWAYPLHTGGGFDTRTWIGSGWRSYKIG
ncbi:CAP domain-containing protein [Tersicoccus sp. MR15.9]|uniref:CAP domain-containing protein n=1 Tax=Tersicoccus mangrovi TaxID=3121635 RepID=UPI002FE5E367